MRISPVSSTIFGKKYTPSEIKKAQKEAENARSRYIALEDKTFLSVDGGMDAWFRAKDYAFEYANNTQEGEQIKKAWANYSDAHTNPDRRDEKEARAKFDEARKAYYAQAAVGRTAYFINNEEDNNIRQEVLQKMSSTKEGQEIIDNYTVAQAKYIDALRSK